jgi:hypothetical protein
LIPNVLILGQSNNNQPYPQSTRFDSIIWSWDTYYFTAPGSDLWPVTWGTDGNIYTSWGDGGGFGGNNNLGRVSLGFARIEGDPTNMNPHNVWGGYNSINPSTFDGKCSALISVENNLYAWINMQNGEPPDFKLAWSDNSGASWNLSDWVFPGSGSFFPSSFINFGKDNENSRDEYIYCYGGLIPYFHGPQDNIYLFRVNKNQILNQNQYEFYAGLDNNGIPLWSYDINERQAVFADLNGTSDGISVIFNPFIQSYILTVCHRPPGGSFDATIGRLGIFISPEPWGPWSTIDYNDNWGNFGDIGAGLGCHIPIKWISNDGKTFWIIFSSLSYLDRFNIVNGRLVESTLDSGETNSALKFNLEQNYPNPFNSSTRIKYSLGEFGNVRITIYDLNGNIIKLLVDEHLSRGSYETFWDGKNFAGKNVSSGVYFYDLIFNGATSYSIRKNMLLLK